MHSYAQLLDAMMDAIVNADAAPADALLLAKQDFTPGAQLGVYIEGYRLRLLDAVESAYPALSYYLGKPEFIKLANGFITAQPSRYFNLDKYAVPFAPYVAAHTSDAFARELAQLEGAIHDIYQREETPAIDGQWAERQTPETLSSAPLLPRAASCLLAFEFPVDDYVSAFRAEEKPDKPLAQKTWLLVLRHKNQVQRLPLEHGEYALLALLAEGLTLAEAFEDPRLAPALEDENFATSLQGWLARWMAQGVLRQPS